MSVDLKLSSEDIKRLFEDFYSDYIESTNKKVKFLDFLAILDVCLRCRDNDDVSDAASVHISTPLFSRNPDLPDAVFSAMYDLVAALISRYRKEYDKTISLKQLESLINELAQANFPNSDFQEITLKAKKSVVNKLKAGDVIRIPDSENLNYYYGIYLEKSRFGHAIGLFKGARKQFSPGEDLKPLSHAVHTGIRLIKSGKWKVVGNYIELVKLFKVPTEVYHYPNERKPFGSAEDSNGNIRNLEKEECEDVRLNRKDYRQTYIEEFLETRIKTLLD